MESLRVLDRFFRGGWRSHRITDTERDKALCHVNFKTSSVAARACVPNRVDDPLCADGDRRRSGLSDARLRHPCERTATFSDTVSIQLPLERHFLQFSSIWTRFHLVGDSMGADSDDGAYL